jgi:hypothetical protein
MRGRRKPKESALRARLDAELGGTSPQPADLSIALRTKEEDILASYCPIIDRRCGDMDCIGCPDLEKEIPGGSWLCSACAEQLGEKSYPHWGEGDCDGCGDRSSFLLLVTP